MPILSNLIVRIGATTDDFDKSVDRSLSKVKRFAADVTAAGTALSVGFSLPIIAAGGAAIKAASDMESLNMGLKAVMKTTDATAAEMVKLREVAKLPGLGLEEAVKGSIRLQILGNSANESRRIMGELGNALAVVGGGKDDFSEVIRQLSQLGAVGKVTKENLDPIIERIPQLAAIIKEKFGAEALGDPAKTFEKLGISSQQFIRIITDELAKGARAGNTYKNSWENIQMAAKDAAAAFGSILLPIAQRVLDDFLTPGIEKAKALAEEFKKLDKPTQDWALGLTAIATAAPLVIVMAGAIAEKAAVLAGVLNKAGVTANGFGAAIGVVALALQSWGDMKEIWGSLQQIGYQLQFVTDQIKEGKKDWDFIKDSVKKLTFDFPILGKAVEYTGRALDNINAILGRPGLRLFAEGLKLISEALSFATGRSREMDDAIGELNKRTVDQGAQNIKLAADMKNFGGAAGDLIPKLGGVAEAHKKVADAASNAIKVNAVMLDEYGNLSKTSLVYVESLERVKAAVGKVKDVMYEYSIAGTILGKQIETHHDPIVEMALATEMYRKELQLLADVTKNVQAIQKPFDFPELPKAQAPFPNLPGNKSISMGVMLGGMNRQFADRFKTAHAAMKQVSTVITDLSRGIADVIFKGGKLGDMFKSVAMQAAQSITRLLIEGALSKLASKLLDVGGIMGKVFGGAGSSAGGSIFSAAAGGGASAAGSIAGGAGGAAGGVASTVGSVGGAIASGGITAVVGAVAGVVGAVSSIIGNFQMMGMNKSLDIIVKHTLQTANDLANLRADEWTREGHLFAKLDDMWKTNIGIYDLLGKGGAGGGSVFNINVNGGDTRAVLDGLTRLLKQHGAIPQNA